MTLCQLSLSYYASAQAIRDRVAELRAQKRLCTTTEEALVLERRIRALLPLLRQCRETALWMEHYYDL